MPKMHKSLYTMRLTSFGQCNHWRIRWRNENSNKVIRVSKRQNFANVTWPVSLIATDWWISKRIFSNFWDAFDFTLSGNTFYRSYLYPWLTDKIFQFNNVFVNFSFTSFQLNGRCRRPSQSVSIPNLIWKSISVLFLTYVEINRKEFLFKRKLWLKKSNLKNSTLKISLTLRWICCCSNLSLLSSDFTFSFGLIDIIDFVELLRLSCWPNGIPYSNSNRALMNSLVRKAYLV